jgi:nitrogen fixation negative regulator NifL
MFFGHRETIYLLLVAREITVQRQQQEKARMAALQAMLSEENRVGALRESLSAAIFQMEKPLNMVASVVSVLERRGQHDPSLDALKGVLRAGEEALASLHRAMPEPTGEMSSPTNLNEILRDVLDLSTARLLFAGISVSWKPQLVLPSVQASPNRLRTMIKALIDNAMEAMNTKRWPTRELTIGTRSLSGSIEMLIGDSGPGIPPDLHLKVFEPFYTTKAGGHHAGTGLSMAQQIVTDHGGTIEIDPERKQGCCVRIVLPTRTERE